MRWKPPSLCLLAERHCAWDAFGLVAGFFAVRSLNNDAGIGGCPVFELNSFLRIWGRLAKRLASASISSNLDLAAMFFRVQLLAHRFLFAFSPRNFHWIVNSFQQLVVGLGRLNCGHAHLSKNTMKQSGQWRSWRSGLNLWLISYAKTIVADEKCNPINCCWKFSADLLIVTATETHSA